MVTIDEIRSLDDKQTYTLEEVRIILRILKENFGARVGDIITSTNLKKAKECLDQLTKQV